jgi:hypothetical protein
VGGNDAPAGVEKHDVNVITIQHPATQPGEPRTARRRREMLVVPSGRVRAGSVTASSNLNRSPAMVTFSIMGAVVVGAPRWRAARRHCLSSRWKDQTAAKVVPISICMAREIRRCMLQVPSPPMRLVIHHRAGRSRCTDSKRLKSETPFRTGFACGKEGMFWARR